MVVPEALRIQSFLKLGYFIDYARTRYPIDFSRTNKRLYVDATREEILACGKECLWRTFSQSFKVGQDNVVPISGGLDSRLILGALLEHTEARNLSTYTFGVPGSYDYELGCLVAKEFGTRHVAFSLKDISYHEDDLLDFARRSDCQAQVFYSPPLREVLKRYGSSIIWSGYIGDLVAGSHLYAQPSPTLADAKRRHLKRRNFVRSTKLHTCADEDLLPFMGGGTTGIGPEDVTFDEQVTFAEAVAKYTEPLVLFQGFEYKTPLINSPWMDFMLSAPDHLRLGEGLMIEIARSAFPRLFGLPSKNSLGLTLGANPRYLTALKYLNKGRKLLHRFVPAFSDPHVLYNDYDQAIRSSPDVRRIVLESIQQLKRRGIVGWLDLDAIVRRHMRRIRNHGDALIILASLELVLRARE